MSVSAPPRLAPLRPVLLWLALVAVGLGWGSTHLFSKIVVDAGHHPIGIAFTGTVIGALLLTGAMLASGRALPLGRRFVIFYLICGATGTALPHVISYEGYKHLPVGVMSVVMAMVPIATMLGALLFRIERVEPRRLLGLLLGLGAIAVLVIPEASLPTPGQSIWIILPVITSLSFAVENIYIAKARPAGLDPMQIMCGLFWASLILLLPVVALSDTWMGLGRFDTAEMSLVAMTLAHACAYGGFVWLIGRAGPVFAAQVSYIVTLTGMFLGMAVLGETHSTWVWLSLALMMGGLALVQPRQ